MGAGRGQGWQGEAREGCTCDASFSRHSCSSSAADDGSATAKALKTPAACRTGSACRLMHSPVSLAMCLVNKQQDSCKTGEWYRMWSCTHAVT